MIEHLKTAIVFAVMLFAAYNIVEQNDAATAARIAAEYAPRIAVDAALRTAAEARP